MTSKVTEQVIVSVKALTEAGVKLPQIASTFNVSTCTISNIKKSGYSYTAYKSLTNKQFGKWRRQSLKKESKPSKTLKSYTNKSSNNKLPSVPRILTYSEELDNVRDNVNEGINALGVNLRDVGNTVGMLRLSLKRLEIGLNKLFKIYNIDTK